MIPIEAELERITQMILIVEGIISSINILIHFAFHPLVDLVLALIVYTNSFLHITHLDEIFIFYKISINYSPGAIKLIKFIRVITICAYSCIIVNRAINFYLQGFHFLDT